MIITGVALASGIGAGVVRWLTPWGHHGWLFVIVPAIAASSLFGAGVILSDDSLVIWVVAAMVVALLIAVFAGMVMDIMDSDFLPGSRWLILLGFFILLTGVTLSGEAEVLEVEDWVGEIFRSAGTSLLAAAVVTELYRADTQKGERREAGEASADGVATSETT